MKREYDFRGAKRGAVLAAPRGKTPSRPFPNSASTRDGPSRFALRRLDAALWLVPGHRRIIAPIPMQARSANVQPNNRTVLSVCKRLENAYGRPRLGNPTDPLDDLVYVVLSNKTGPIISSKVYRRLRDRFPTWEKLSNAPLSRIRAILKPAGLSKVKSWQLKGALRLIKKQFGRCDLKLLKSLPAEQTEAFLVSLPGVSEKVAKCIMMYTLNAQVLPVDVHVHRVARRLGWTSWKRADQCHQELETLVPPKWRYVFHVGCILHGRRICRSHEPRCHDCFLKNSCRYYFSHS